MKRSYNPLIPGFVLLLCAGDSHAASFDCGKAKQPAETLICTVPALSELDSQLADKYRANLTELSPSAANRLKIGQREWLAYWPRYCADGGAKLNVKAKDVRTCAEQEYKVRINTLGKQQRILEGLLVYPVDHYRVMKSTAGVDFAKVAHHTDSGLAIDIDAASPQQRPLAQALNAWLADLPVAANTEGDEESTNDSESQLELGASASSIILSATCSYYWFGHGAAHPLSTSGQLHLHLPSRRPLQTSDIFQGNAWQEGLTRLVEQALKKELTDNYSVDTLASLQAMVIQPGLWSFGKDGLTLQFNPYDVAPYAAGAPSVTIAWSSLQAWLNPAFLDSLKK